MPAAPATRIEAPNRAGRHRGLRRGDPIAPGRRVLRRLDDGGDHEAFLVATGASGLPIGLLFLANAAAVVVTIAGLSRRELGRLRRWPAS